MAFDLDRRQRLDRDADGRLYHRAALAAARVGDLELAGQDLGAFGQIGRVRGEGRDPLARRPFDRRQRGRDLR